MFVENSVLDSYSTYIFFLFFIFLFLFLNHCSFLFQKVFNFFQESSGLLLNQTFPDIPQSPEDLANMNRTQVTAAQQQLAERVRLILCGSGEDGEDAWGNHTEYLLLLDDPRAQEEVVSALCNLTSEQFVLLYEDIVEDSSFENLMVQMTQCSQNHGGNSFNTNQDMLDNLWKIADEVR